MTHYPVTMRVVCGRCGAVARVPAFTRGRARPHHCGAAMLDPQSRHVRVADALTAMAHGLARGEGFDG